jgi:hypothetical protein
LVVEPISEISVTTAVRRASCSGHGRCSGGRACNSHVNSRQFLPSEVQMRRRSTFIDVYRGKKCGLPSSAARAPSIASQFAMRTSGVRSPSAPPPQPPMKSRYSAWCGRACRRVWGDSSSNSFSDALLGRPKTVASRRQGLLPTSGDERYAGGARFTRRVGAGGAHAWLGGILKSSELDAVWLSRSVPAAIMLRLFFGKDF